MCLPHGQDWLRSPGAWSRGHRWVICGLEESLLCLPKDSDRFYSLLHLVDHGSSAYEDFRDRLIALVGVRAASEASKS